MASASSSLVIVTLSGFSLWIGAAGSPQSLAAEEAAGREATTLRSRIAAYWEARVAERYEEEYGFLDPLVREQIPLAKFVEARQPYHVLAFRILEVNSEGTLARARISFTFEVILPNPVEAGAPPIRALGPKEEELLEVWVKRDGVWFKTLTQPPRRGGNYGLPVAQFSLDKVLEHRVFNRYV